MGYPWVDVEWACERCGVEFEAHGRYVRCSMDDPYDVDFEPEPVCPNCGYSRHVVRAEDAQRCGVCGKANHIGELCAECAEAGHGGAFAGTDEDEQRQALRTEYYDE